MVEEYDSIMQNNVWDVVPRPGDKSVVTSRWLYKVKHVTDGSMEKQKARIDSYVTGLGFTKSEADANLYHIFVDDKLLIIVLYVDDLILIDDDQLIKSCKKDLSREFEMKDMGLMHYFLGMWTEGVKLQGFMDADWASSPSDKKSTSRGIFNLGSDAVSWYSWKQRSVALSTVEIKYMAASQANCEAI
eukprot:PITA_10617